MPHLGYLNRIVSDLWNLICAGFMLSYSPFPVCLGVKKSFPGSKSQD